MLQNTQRTCNSFYAPKYQDKYTLDRYSIVFTRRQKHLLLATCVDEHFQLKNATLNPNIPD